MEKKQDIITIKEIAEGLGISTTTVSRILSNKGRFSQKNKERVLSYVEESGRSPHISKKEKISKPTMGILVTVPSERDYGLLPYFSEVLMSVYDYFQPLGYHIMVAKTGLDDISALKQIIKERKCDGVILSRTIENAIDIKFLKENNIPFVVIGSYDDSSVYQVDVNQQAGCQELTKYILDKGYRNIALFCANRTHVVTKSRYKGFMKAFNEKGIDINQSLIFEDTGYVDVADRLTEKMVQDGIECIVCMDDNICVNVLNSLKRLGAKIPSDMAVVSFYNSKILDEYFPPITAVNLDISELSIKASELLYKLLMKEVVKRWEVTGYQILYRGSTR